MGLKFDEALKIIEEREQADTKPEARIAAPRARYPDLASKVVEEELTTAAGAVEASAPEHGENEDTRGHRNHVRIGPPSLDH